MSGNAVILTAAAAITEALAIAITEALAIAAITVRFPRWHARHERKRRQNERAREVNANRNPGLPVNGRPLDDYEKHLLASVLLDCLASPDGESSDEKEDHR